MADLIRFSVAARAYVLPVAVHIQMRICAFRPPVAGKKVADGVDTDTKVEYVRIYHREQRKLRRE